MIEEKTVKLPVICDALIFMCYHSVDEEVMRQNLCTSRDNKSWYVFLSDLFLNTWALPMGIIVWLWSDRLKK